MPLLNHRWIGLQAATAASARADVREAAPVPAGPQYGVRFNHVGRRSSTRSPTSAATIDLPLLARSREARTATAADGDTRLSRDRGIRRRSCGAVRRFALKAEGAWLEAREGDTDEYCVLRRAGRTPARRVAVAGRLGRRGGRDRTRRAGVCARSRPGPCLVGRASYTHRPHPKPRDRERGAPGRRRRLRQG